MSYNEKYIVISGIAEFYITFTECAYQNVFSPLQILNTHTHTENKHNTRIV